MDEWPVTSDSYNKGRGSVLVNQPTTTEERAELALRFKRDFKMGEEMELLVDTPECNDKFELLFAADTAAFFYPSWTRPHNALCSGSLNPWTAPLWAHWVGSLPSLKASE